MTRLFLGIDGGGTNTRAVICDENGQILAVGHGGPSGIDSVGAEGAKRGIGDAVADARRQANLPEQPFASIFLGMAGVVSEEDRNIVRGVVRVLELGETVGVDHDIRISLAGGLSGRFGIALISGTGSSCFGQNERGERWQAGGWGHLIADEGSSYWFGWNAIRLAVGDYDGRWRSALRQPVQQQLGIAQMLDIHNRLYTQGISKAEIAAFAPLVFEAAAAGDAKAQQLIEQGTHDLAQMVWAVAHHLGWMMGCEVTLTGGLWRAGEAVIAPFRRTLHTLLPQAQIVMPEMPPVLGACILALQQAGVTVDAECLGRLAKQNELAQ
ncbi:MAG: BadF/BadG/BcrA/BcrD ATPase family protein [Caldilineaceae bacterium]